MIEGNGRYYYHNGHAFEGNFKRGRRHGKGNYELSDKRMDVHLYVNGARVGDGVRWSSDRKKAWRLVKKGGKVQQNRIGMKEAIEITRSMVLTS